MKKNICMIGYTIYMTDNRIRREAETLAALPEYSVHMLSLKENENSPRTYIHDGICVQELNIQKYRGKSTLRYIFSYMQFMLLAFAACNRLLFRQSLDIVHIHNMPNFVIFSALLPIIRGKKVVLDVHDTMVETYASKFKGKFSKIFKLALRLEEYVCCSLADRIVCVNHVQKDALVNRGIPEIKITISMNVPDPKRIKGNVKSHQSLMKESFNLVYFGTIANRLGIDLAIQAVSMLTEKIPDIRLYIFGDGDDLDQCIQLTKCLGMQNNIIFEEGMLLEELVKRIGNMDAVIVPNRKNSATELMLPVKMLDGIALGLPIIAPKLAAIQHYFTDQMIFFFEPESVGSLADVIFSAFKNESARQEKASQASKFLEQYGWETHKYDLINMYKSLFN